MFNQIKKLTESTLSQLGHELEALAVRMSEETFKISVTGLSRSGKSMLFTTLITLLNERAKPNALHVLPLLQSLPVDEVERFEVRAIEGFNNFPIQQALQHLQQQRWPEPTEQIYGFELVLQLRPRHLWDRTLARYGAKRTVVLQFFDYPGEWLTDLPMLTLNYGQWCQQVVAQLGSGPQRSLASEWLDLVAQFDFESAPTAESVSELTQAYRKFLLEAKSKGLSLLQPSGFLLETTKFDWKNMGFVPLPTEIATDLKHPWFEVMNAHFLAYQTTWLTPLRQKYFMGFDRQIVLVDLLSGVAQGRSHLLQLKEALTRLADIFVLEQKHWWQQWLGLNRKKNRVAFVATKADLLPRRFQKNLLHLLKEITQGAQAKYAQDEVDFEHFVVSSIRATKEESDQRLLYLATPHEVRRRVVTCFPNSVSEVSQGHCRFQAIACVPPQDAVDCMAEAQNLDRLFEYMMASVKEMEDEPSPK